MKIFCARQPRICTGFFKALKDQKKHPIINDRNRLFQSQILFKESSINYNRHLADTILKNKDVSCHFSNEANKLVSKLADVVSKKDYSGKDIMIEDIKSYIKDLVLLPRSNLICKYTHDDVEETIRHAFKTRDSKTEKHGKDELKDLLSGFTIERNTISRHYNKKMEKMKVVTKTKTLDIPEKSKLMKVLLNLFTDVAFKRKGKKSINWNYNTMEKERKFENNLKQLFMFISSKESNRSA